MTSLENSSSSGTKEGPKVYSFKVAMTCDGCSGAVRRVLSKMEGLEVEKVSWEDKQVVVKAPNGSPDFESVLQKIAKTGKAVLSGEVDGVQQYPTAGVGEGGEAAGNATA